MSNLDILAKFKLSLILGCNYFFNLGFSNRWQKLLPIDIKDKVNEKFKKSLAELNYLND